MGILDALTILGSGVGKGYRGSQEIQRQIAEARRKALIDEQEQARADRLASLQERLGSSTIGLQDVQRNTGQFGLDEARRQSTAAQEPLTTGGRFKLGVLDNNFDFPSTSEKFKTFQDTLNEILGNASRERSALFNGGSGRTPLTPMERRSKYLMDTVTSPNLLEIVDPSARQPMFDQAIELFKKYDPEAFADTVRKVLSDTTDVGGFIDPKLNSDLEEFNKKRKKKGK